MLRFLNYRTVIYLYKSQYISLYPFFFLLITNVLYKPYKLSRSLIGFYYKFKILIKKLPLIKRFLIYSNILN